MMAVVTRKEEGRTESSNCLICEEFCGRDVAFVGVVGAWRQYQYSDSVNKSCCGSTQQSSAGNAFIRKSSILPPISQMRVIRTLVEVVQPEGTEAVIMKGSQEQLPRLSCGEFSQLFCCPIT